MVDKINSYVSALCRCAEGSNSSGDLKPAIGEVVCDAKMGHGLSSITWTYARPRAVTSLIISPVPFTLTRRIHLSSAHNADAQVQCVLQRWDVIDRCYHDYGRLWLREGESNSCRLPGPGDDGVAMAAVWRIVIEDQAQKLALESLSAAGLRCVYCNNNNTT